MSHPGMQNGYQHQPIMVENIATFRRTQQPLDVYNFPEIPQKRRTTDVSFLIIFAICSVILLSLMAYTLNYSDIRRLTHGYDACGNICGEEHQATEGCAPSQYPGPNHNDCQKLDVAYFEAAGNTIKDESTNLAILCLLGLGFSLVALVVFRYNVGAFVWTMLIASVLLLFALTGWFWYWYFDVNSTDSKSSGPLVPALFFTILAIVCTIFLVVLRKRINLIIRFYEEAVRLVFTMPIILLEPVLTFVANFIVLALFVYTFVLMETSGFLEKIESSTSGIQYDYIPNKTMVATKVISVVMMLWMVQFVLACQHMVISGAVATCYFARSKMAVVSPIYNSFYSLIRYHLGSVALGSFVITVITVIKILIRGLLNNCVGRICYICCFKPIEDFLKYLTSMGYIMTAIHGQPLCRSSARALNLIVTNFLSAVVMNSVGNFVFFMAKLAIVVLTVGIGFALKASGIIIFLGGVTALLCSHCFLVVFEVAVDTIFLCYCEDQCFNDGNTNPYFASTQFYTSVKEVQALTKQLEKKKK